MAAIALLGLVELIIRQAGLVDFPIYVRDDRFGYVPGPAQQGVFMRTNRWFFNDRHMGVAENWSPNSGRNLVLIGNSVVMGGNPYDQAEKVGPVFQSIIGTGCKVWPVAAGGWSTVNESRFLEAHPEVVDTADFFVWQQMAGQLASLHPWREETQHPTRQPWWATGYVARKALVQRFGLAGASSTPASSDRESHYVEFEQVLGRLTSATRHRPAGMIFLYPDQRQLEQARAGHEWMDDRHRIEELAARYGLLVLDVARSPRWTPAMYKDGVHPTSEGNRTLAALLADAFADAAGTEFCEVGASPRPLGRRPRGQ